MEIVINPIKIKPVFSNIITTMDKYKEDTVSSSTGLLTFRENTVKEFQTVIAVGTGVTQVKEGDLIKVNPARYAIIKQSKENSISKDIEKYSPKILGYNFKTVEIDNQTYLHLYEQDIEYIVEEFKEVEENSPTIITPPTPTIISKSSLIL